MRVPAGVDLQRRVRRARCGWFRSRRRSRTGQGDALNPPKTCSLRHRTLQTLIYSPLCQWGSPRLATSVSFDVLVHKGYQRLTLWTTVWAVLGENRHVILALVLRLTYITELRFYCVVK